MRMENKSESMTPGLSRQGCSQGAEGSEGVLPKKEPPADDPSHEDWESDNLTVMSWLLLIDDDDVPVSEAVLLFRSES